MAAARLLMARARVRAGVLAGVAAVAVVLAGLGTIVGGLLLAAPVTGVRAGLAAATGADGSMRWQTRLADDGGAQSDAAAHVLDRLLVPSDPVAAARPARTPVTGAASSSPPTIVPSPASTTATAATPASTPARTRARAISKRAAATRPPHRPGRSRGRSAQGSEGPGIRGERRVGTAYPRDGSCMPDPSTYSL